MYARSLQNRLKMINKPMGLDFKRDQEFLQKQENLLLFVSLSIG